MTTKEINSIKYAISIRQPYVEQILQSIKNEEYRSTKTNIRGRVYLYASLKDELDADWDSIKCQAGDLPKGVIVGTVDIVDCKKIDDGYFAYSLEKPERLERYLKVLNQPQPKFWIPQFENK